MELTSNQVQILLNLIKSKKDKLRRLIKHIDRKPMQKGNKQLFDLEVTKLEILKLYGIEQVLRNKDL